MHNWYMFTTYTAVICDIMGAIEAACYNAVFALSDFNYPKREEIEMEKKNVVSIEDRIPTLKQERKKKLTAVLYFIFLFFLFNFYYCLSSVALK